MSRIYKTGKTKVAIGKASEDVVTLATFEADTTYVEFDGITNIGGFGDTASLITSDHVNSGRTKKAVGTRNAGSMTLACDRQPNDPGQLAGIAAADTDDRYNIRVTIPVGKGKFEVDYLTCYVLSRNKDFGGSNDAQKITFNLELDEAPISKPAAV
ncbi:hypothetical protein [Aureimonas sp. AU12]|uniref:hypothetical protein n=1 Tax=Aureimonas sp. AU12 TaxID=1638161 RepID=UPI0007864414|nr:hypothetical protein [Aureimonas sp. AU12]